MKKRLLCLAMVMCMVFSLAACNSTEDSSGSTDTDKTESSGGSSDGDTIKVGFSVYWMSEFTTLMQAAMEENAQSLGVELLVSDGDQDPQKQLSQIENFINQEVDAIICAAIDPDAMAPGIEKAKEAGIPFVAINMVIPNEDVTAYVGPDDILAGELAAQYVVDSLDGKGNVIVIKGGDGFSATSDRQEGIENVLNENSDITVLESQTAEWDRSTAVSLMENYIQSYGEEIQGVIAHNDEMALGALQALESAGMGKDVFIGGIDAIKDACVKINDGYKYATVFQDPHLEGTLGLEYAVKLAKGEAVDPVENYINMELVTSDNVSGYYDAD